MGMNQENHDLFDAVNAGVKWLWKSKQNAELLAEIWHGQPGLSGAARKPIRASAWTATPRATSSVRARITPKDYSALFA